MLKKWSADLFYNKKNNLSPPQPTKQKKIKYKEFKLNFCGLLFHDYTKQSSPNLVCGVLKMEGVFAVQKNESNLRREHGDTYA